MKAPLILLDGDTIIYRACLGKVAPKDPWRSEGVLEKTYPPEAQAIDKALWIAEEWARKAAPQARGNTKGIHACFSSEDWQFRKALGDGSYKANRAAEKPEHYDAVKRALKEAFCVYPLLQEAPGLEADDLIGIYATNQDIGFTVAVSIDKDFETIPGRIFNPDKYEKVRTFQKGGADKMWMAQTLAGDSVDNYSGIPGIGPAKAAKILDGVVPNIGPLWGAVRSAYIEKGLSEADALLSARYARILRHGDYDFKKQEVMLWHPEMSKVKRFGRTEFDAATSGTTQDTESGSTHADTGRSKAPRNTTSSAPKTSSTGSKRKKTSKPRKKPDNPAGPRTT